MMAFNIPKVSILVAAIISPLVTMFQLASSACILCSLKPSNRRHGYYTYYLEMPNGTRIRQMAEVVYDERREQIIFFHAFLIAFVLPGLLMPCLLWLARKRPILFVWWACWATLHNVHALMGLFTYSMHLAIIIYYRGFSNFDAHFGSFWASFGLCSLATTLNNLVAPLTTFLSIYLLRYYMNLKEFSAEDNTNGIVANSEGDTATKIRLQLPDQRMVASSPSSPSSVALLDQRNLKI